LYTISLSLSINQITLSLSHFSLYDLIIYSLYWL
jgi:hypothetical protein